MCSSVECIFCVRSAKILYLYFFVYNMQMCTYKMNESKSHNSSVWDNQNTEEMTVLCIGISKHKGRKTFLNSMHAHDVYLDATKSISPVLLHTHAIFTWKHKKNITYNTTTRRAFMSWWQTQIKMGFQFKSTSAMRYTRMDVTNL